MAYILVEYYTLKSAFDFGGQEQYRKEYMDKPDVFRGTDILIPIVDLHDPDKFDEAKEYFDGLLDIYRKCLTCLAVRGSRPGQRHPRPYRKRGFHAQALP